MRQRITVNVMEETNKRTGTLGEREEKKAKEEKKKARKKRKKREKCKNKAKYNCKTFGVSGRWKMAAMSKKEKEEMIPRLR